MINYKVMNWMIDRLVGIGVAASLYADVSAIEKVVAALPDSVLLPNAKETTENI